MSNEQIITLYDFASQSGKPRAWNPLSLKTRYALNFKKIPYKTVWLEYPDIEPTVRRIGAEPTLRKIGAPPTSKTPDGSPFYTLPVISDPSHRTPDGGPTVLSETWVIAEYLDEAYPSTGQLFPDGTKAMAKLFHDHTWNATFTPSLPILAPLAHDFLNEKSRIYWRQTREAYFGTKLEDICPKGSPKWEEAWAKLEKGFTQVAVLLDRNGSGAETLAMGSRVTYVDLALASLLETIFLAVPEEWEDRVKHWDGGRWERLRNLCADWRSVH